MATEKRYPQPDTRWLTKAIDASGLTRNAIAKHLDIRPSSVTQIVSGERMTTPGEALELARIFGVRPEEVFRRLGYDWPEPVPATAPLVGYVRADSTVDELPPEKQERRFPPRGGDDKLAALELAYWDARYGWATGTRLWFRPGSVSPDARDRLCVVRFASRGAPVVGVVIAAPLGSLGLLPINGDGALVDRATMAAPVLYVEAG